eukprot:scaffold710_cov171-Amphora_coffeaeformis.AAC.12
MVRRLRGGADAKTRKGPQGRGRPFTNYHTPITSTLSMRLGQAISFTTLIALAPLLDECSAGGHLKIFGLRAFGLYNNSRPFVEKRQEDCGTNYGIDGWALLRHQTKPPERHSFRRTLNSE